MRNVLSDREKALEYDFFHKVDEQLLQKLRDKLADERQLELLADTTGIHHEGILNELAELGLNSETICALSLVPLVEVAWSDGRVSRAERNAILSVTPGGSGNMSDQLVANWLRERPDQKLFQTWKHYVAALSETLSPDAKEAMKREVVERARAVARATDSVFGIDTLSSAEKRLLLEIENAFDAPAPSSA